MVLNIMDHKKIKRVMRQHINECRDSSTNELNHTLLAERAADILDLYVDHENYDIPEEVFEIAAEFN